MLLFGGNIKTCFFFFDNIRIYFKTFLETDLFYIYISLIKYFFFISETLAKHSKKN